MSWQVVVHNTARKYLKRIPAKDSLDIEKVLDDLENNPYAGDIQKMKDGQNIWRRRVGAYRIIYETSVDKRAIFILDIKRRTSKTYK